METIPTTSRSLDHYYHINGDTFEKQYKEVLSGYREWSELSHAEDWLVFPENIGESICIDETAPSNGELYTIVSNRSSRGGKGTIIAIVKGVAASAVTEVLMRIDEDKRLLAQGKNIKIELDDSAHDYLQVCYDESVMIRRLSVYPYIQLGVVLLFVVIAIFALLTSKRAEQNKVWVGLSKETAHQLGTPISSLMAWIEILRMNYPDDELIPEMNQDVKRLQLIADRFSKIGSLPEPVPASLNEVLEHVIAYMDRRTSRKVQLVKDFPSHEVIVRMNASLFEWVIENLCKNAVDAMGAEGGRITLRLMEASHRAIIEVEDTGKGIRKKDLKHVFRPGFTTKQRGWGLGLSLAKRIVEEYHHGKIWIKNSEPGKGTTFRIELKMES